MTATAKKTLSIILKVTLLVLAFTFIYHKYLEKGENIKQFKQLIAKLDHTHVTVIMSLVFILMFVNWLLESLKWKFLTRNLTPITLWQSIEGVFCGLTWAIFTPNRIGDFGGRVMFLPPRWRIHGVFAMGVGSFGQNVITNVLGATAIMWFVIVFKQPNIWILVGGIILTIAFISVFIIVYFNLNWIVKLFDRISFLKKYHRFFEIMGRYKLSELLKIMGFCLARFATFSFQYYLLIHMLVPAIPAFDMMMMVFIVFIIQSALPSLDLIDVAVRSTAAATFFAYITNQEIAIITAFAAIWLINLIIPAILGSVFIFKLNFFGRNS